MTDQTATIIGRPARRVPAVNPDAIYQRLNYDRTRRLLSHRAPENLHWDDAAAVVDHPDTDNRVRLRAVLGWRHTVDEAVDLFDRALAAGLGFLGSGLHWLRGRDDLVLAALERDLVDYGTVQYLVRSNTLLNQETQVQLAAHGIERWPSLAGWAIHQPQGDILPQVREVFTTARNAEFNCHTLLYGQLTPAEQHMVVDWAILDGKPQPGLTTDLVLYQVDLDPAVVERLNVFHTPRDVTASLDDLMDEDLGFNVTSTGSGSDEPQTLFERREQDLLAHLASASATSRARIRSAIGARKHQRPQIAAAITERVVRNPNARPENRTRLLYDIPVERVLDLIDDPVVGGAIRSRIQPLSPLVIASWGQPWVCARLAGNQLGPIPSELLLVVVRRGGPGHLFDHLPAVTARHVLASQDDDLVWFAELAAERIGAAGDPDRALTGLLTADPDTTFTDAVR
jgi:hypothetical protein